MRGYLNDCLDCLIDAHLHHRRLHLRGACYHAAAVGVGGGCYCCLCYCCCCGGDNIGGQVRVANAVAG